MVLHIHIYMYTYHYLHVYVYIILHDLTWSFICWLSMAIPMALGGQLPSLRTGRTAAIGAGNQWCRRWSDRQTKSSPSPLSEALETLGDQTGNGSRFAWAGKNKHILFIFHINDPFLEVSNIFTQRKQRGDMTAKNQQWVHLQQVQHREIEIRI